MNKAIIMGRITRDPEIRYTQNNNAVCAFTVAVNRINKRDEADFISCKAWNKVAENLGKYVKKGDRVLVEGSITTGSYEKDGRKIYTTDVSAWTVQFLDLHKKDGGFAPTDEPMPEQFVQAMDQASLDEDLPF